jgi:hypothetical protein
MLTKKVLLVIIVGIFLLTACAGTTLQSTENSEVTQAASNHQVTPDIEDVSGADETQIPENTILPDYDKEDLDVSVDSLDVTYIQLNGDQITFQGSGVTVEGSLVSITSSGAYLVSGILNDGQIVVDTEDEEPVRLILNGVVINSTSSAPIYVRNAEKTILTLSEGTENRVMDGTEYVLEEENEHNAAIFSNDDLTINGSGTLIVDANYNNGIDSDDDLKIISGSISVTSVNDGIKGKDSLTIKDGFISVNAGGDGLQANNDVDEGEGNIIIEGGNFNITADKDGFQAVNTLSISAGKFNIVSGEGSANANLTDIADWGDWDRQSTSNDTDISTKGLKTESGLFITGGTFEIDSLDDSIHSNGTIRIDGGSFTLSTGDDGIHADSILEINGGSLDIMTSYEGLESAAMTINDGTIHIESVNDGINGSSGTASMGGRPGMGGFGAGDNTLVINGGTVYIDADGDGIDINGSLTINDGTVIVNGPINNANGAFDAGNFDIFGGFIVGVGSSGKAISASQSSIQNSILYNFETPQTAGQIIHIETQSGEEIVTFESTKTYQSLLFSSPELMDGVTYDIYAGGSVSGTLTDGIASGGVYAQGVLVDSLTIADVVTTAGAAGGQFGGGRGGFPAGGGGDRGGQGEFPPTGSDDTTAPPDGMPQRGGVSLDEVT